jgi:hypothetical protein
MILPAKRGGTAPSAVEGARPLRLVPLATSPPLCGGGMKLAAAQTPASIFASMKPEPALVPAPGQVEAPTMYKRSIGVR